MDRKYEARELTQAFVRGEIDRRVFLRRAIALGISLPTLTMIIAACGGDDDDDGDSDDSAAASTETEASSDETSADDTTEEATEATDETEAAEETEAASETTEASTGGDDPGQGGTLIVDLASQPENLDPAQGLAYTTALITGQIHEALIDYERGGLTLVPKLAESWDQSEDGTEWTFTLRSGVKFHDGTGLNAETVKFTIERQLASDQPTYNPRLGAIVKEVRADSDQVVTFVLNEANTIFIDLIAAIAIVSKDNVEKTGDAIVENPVGTGPYKFVQWDQGQQVILERNEDYWNGTPSLDQVVYRWITEDGARLAALLSGEVHMAIDVSPEIAQQLEASGSHSVITGPTGSLWFLAMNVETEAFDDVRVRQAVNFAVDKQTIVTDVLKDTVELAHGIIGPAWVDYNPAVEDYFTYDPDRARELLEEAGWSEDTKVTFYASIGGSGMLQPEEMATVIQDNLREVGINSDLDVREFVAWMDVIRSPENVLTMMSWNLNPTEPYFMFTGVLGESSLPPGFNTSYWTTDEYEELMDTALTAIDPEDAHEAYMKAQIIIMEEAPIVPVCHALQVYGVSNRVHNFSAEPSMNFEITDVWVES